VVGAARAAAIRVRLQPLDPREGAAHNAPRAQALVLRAGRSDGARCSAPADGQESG
jgi:hypothetical protein